MRKNHANRRSTNSDSTPAGEMSTADLIPQLLTVAQVAKKLHMSTSTVYSMCDRHVLQWCRPNGPTGHRRIYAQSVKEYLESIKPERVQEFVPVKLELEPEVNLRHRLRNIVKRGGYE